MLHSFSHASGSTQDAMAVDQFLGGSQEQPLTQSTQPGSQQDNPVDSNSQYWGYLLPCTPTGKRINLYKFKLHYTVGRSESKSRHHDDDIWLAGPKISGKHCTIVWDGMEDQSSSVVVRDLSSNGTYINQMKIGKSFSRILKDGNEISFGSANPQREEAHDHRYIYRFTATGLPPTHGVYASYDFANPLGTGSFGTVMRAVHRATETWYAIKMIRPKGTLKHTKQFMREIDIMERLQHPNICQLKEWFIDDTKQIYLVLELARCTLMDYLIVKKELDETLVQHLAYQICDALAYIHNQGITHRDLKPENILLHLSNPPHVKVADFGLAKLVTSHTDLRTKCGTPRYVAPEVSSPEGYDNRVDSWSAGVVVFEMFTGAAPFIGDINGHVVVNWNLLWDVHASRHAEAFIRLLIEQNPRLRMSMTDAKNHPWLQTYTPLHPTTTESPVTGSTTPLPATGGSGLHNVHTTISLGALNMSNQNVGIGASRGDTPRPGIPQAETERTSTLGYGSWASVYAPRTHSNSPIVNPTVLEGSDSDLTPLSDEFEEVTGGNRVGQMEPEHVEGHELLSMRGKGRATEHSAESTHNMPRALLGQSVGEKSGRGGGLKVQEANARAISAVNREGTDDIATLPRRSVRDK